ncbi:MAG: hypothetical protein RLZZ458_115, partial [Planctomycetota bacterium]
MLKVATVPQDLLQSLMSPCQGLPAQRSAEEHFRLSRRSKKLRSRRRHITLRLQKCRERLPSQRKRGEIGGLKRSLKCVEGRLEKVEAQLEEGPRRKLRWWCRVVPARNAELYKGYGYASLTPADAVFVVVDLAQDGDAVLHDPAMRGQWLLTTDMPVSHDGVGVQIAGMDVVVPVSLDWNLELASTISASFNLMVGHFGLSLTGTGSQHLKVIDRLSVCVAKLSVDERAALRDRIWRRLYPGLGPAPVPRHGSDSKGPCVLPFFPELFREIELHPCFEKICRKAQRVHSGGAPTDSPEAEAELSGLYWQNCRRLGRSYYRNCERWLADSNGPFADGPLGPILHSTFRSDMQRLLRGKARGKTFSRLFRSFLIQISELRTLLGMSPGSCNFPDPFAAADHIIEHSDDIRAEQAAYAKLLRLLVTACSRKGKDKRAVNGPAELPDDASATPPEKPNVRRAVNRRAKAIVRLLHEITAGDVVVADLQSRLQTLAVATFKGADDPKPRSDDPDAWLVRLAAYGLDAKPATVPDVELQPAIERVVVSRKNREFRRKDWGLTDPASLQKSQQLAISVQNLVDLRAELRRELLKIAERMQRAIADDATAGRQSLESQQEILSERLQMVIQRYNHSVIAAAPASCLMDCLQSLTNGMTTTELAIFCAAAVSAEKQTLYTVFQQWCPGAFQKSLQRSNGAAQLDELVEKLQSVLLRPEDGIGSSSLR